MDRKKSTIKPQHKASILINTLDSVNNLEKNRHRIPTISILDRLFEEAKRYHLNCN